MEESLSGLHMIKDAYAGRVLMLIGVTWTMTVIAIIPTELRTYTNAIIIKRFSWGYYWAVLILVRCHDFLSAPLRNEQTLMGGANRWRRSSESFSIPLPLSQNWATILNCSIVDGRSPRSSGPGWDKPCELDPFWIVQVHTHYATLISELTIIQANKPYTWSTCKRSLQAKAFDGPKKYPLLNNVQISPYVPLRTSTLVLPLEK